MVTVTFKPYFPTDETGAIGRFVINGNSQGYNFLKMELSNNGWLVEEPHCTKNHGYVRVLDKLQKDEIEKLLDSLAAEKAFSR